MRILSDTKENGKVVELTQEEWHEFRALALAVDGKEESDTWQFGSLYGPETAFTVGSGIQFKGTFGAIRAFYQAKFKFKQLQNLLDAMKAAVESNP